MSAAVDFWLPSPPLQACVSGYHRYHLNGGGPGERVDDVFFPAWANIRFSPGAEPWSVEIGRRRFDPVPESAFFGPSSHAGYVSVSAGALIGIGLTPLGWARLHGGDISQWADRVVPLEEVFPWLAASAGAIAAADDPPAVFDPLLNDALERAPPAHPAIEIIFARLLDPAVERVADLGEGLGLNARQVARLTRAYFGFTPKLLLRRARFLRALGAIRALDRGQWKNAIAAAGYWDGSHFLRDCHLFLGKPLSEFMAMPRPVNRASMERRTTILGAPMQSLHDPQVPAR